MGPNPYDCVLVERGNWRQTRTQGERCEHGWPSASSGEWPGTDSLPQRLSGEAASDTMILDFWIPEQWGDKFVLFKPPGLWYLFGQPQEQIRGGGLTLFREMKKSALWPEPRGPGGAGSSGWLHWVPVGDARGDLRWESFT